MIDPRFFKSALGKSPTYEYLFSGVFLIGAHRPHLFGVFKETDSEIGNGLFFLIPLAAFILNPVTRFCPLCDLLCPAFSDKLGVYALLLGNGGIDFLRSLSKSRTIFMKFYTSIPSGCESSLPD
jgi:hypothetical protein